MRLALLALAACTAAGCTDAAAPDLPLETPTALTHNPLGPDPLAENAAAPALSPDSLTGTFDGYYSAGMEHSGFIPCADTTELWWSVPARAALPAAGGSAQLGARADLRTRYAEASGDRVPEPGSTLFGSGATVWMRLRGRATPRRPVAGGGGYGHLGSYTRAFAVDSVEAAARDTTVAGCSAPRSARP